MVSPAGERFRNPENSMAFIALAVTTVVMGLVATVYAAEYAPALVVVALAGSGLMLWVWFNTFIRARVEADTDGIRVINPFHNELIPWNEVERCEGGRLLTIWTTTGRTVRAWSVQNSNWSHLRGQSGYADAVSEQIMGMRNRYGAG